MARLTESEKAEVWDRYRAGDPMRLEAMSAMPEGGHEAAVANKTWGVRRFRDVRRHVGNELPSFLNGPGDTRRGMASGHQGALHLAGVEARSVLRHLRSSSRGSRSGDRLVTRRTSGVQSWQPRADPVHDHSPFSWRVR